MKTANSYSLRKYAVILIGKEPGAGTVLLTGKFSKWLSNGISSSPVSLSQIRTVKFVVKFSSLFPRRWKAVPQGFTKRVARVHTFSCVKVEKIPHFPEVILFC